MRRPGSLILILLVLLVPALARGAHAQEAGGAEAALGFSAFPRGKLAPDQLAGVAAAIRRLEAAPLAPDGEDARALLLAWLSDSPDVTVHLCADLLPGAGEGSPYSRMVMMQSLLSAGAHVIENPGAARDVAAATLGGIRGALHGYGILKARLGDAARSESTEKLLRLQELGELEAHVRTQSAGCDAS